VVKLFGSIFLFIALVMGVIVLFAVVNTMTMNVMERTNEIGTIRAMGVRRRSIRSQFIVEGSLIGAFGATVGALLAVTIAAVLNGAGLTWVPPGNANPVPLQVDVLGRPGPHRRHVGRIGSGRDDRCLDPSQSCSRLSVVDALRHV